MNSSIDNEDVPDYNNFGFSRLARFILYLIFEFPAVICSLFILCVFCMDRTCRNELRNHAVMLLLFVNFLSQLFNIPVYMDQLRVGPTWSKPTAFCLAWRFIDSSCFAATPVLLAWLSVERHVLIFHSHFFNNDRNRLLLHYLPPVILFLYIYIFYFIVVVYPPCENNFDAFCGGICFFYVTWLSLWDLIGHNILPTLIILLSSSTILLRTIRQRQRFHQPVQWRKLRRMTLQLVSLSSVFLIFGLPATLCFSILPFGTHNTDELFAALPYVAYFSFFPQLLLPFICFFTVPTLWPKLKRILHIQQQPRAIAPMAY